MNLLDFAVLALLLLLLVRGYSRGFFRELFSLAAWGGAGLAGYLLGPAFGPAVSARLGLPIAIGEALAALGIFAGLYLACQLCGFALHHLARALFLGPIDRAGGLLLGAAKAVVIAALFCMVVTSRRGWPALSERVHDSPMLSGLVEEAWNVVAIARESSGMQPIWRHPYSRAEIEARQALSRFLTPKPSPTAPPRARGAAPGGRE
ncbi:MAG: CvpA family protein [Deltaproteobacteria bacterium]|nr:CvpA family protein [Deltaproteobacteria bacterium]